MDNIPTETAKKAYTTEKKTDSERRIEQTANQREPNDIQAFIFGGNILLIEL